MKLNALDSARRKINRGKRLRDPAKNFLLVIEFAVGVYEALGEDPPTRSLLMYGLGALEAPPSVTELAECCGLTLKSASRGVKYLRDRGWITYEGDKKDERKRRVRLTPAGANVLRLINGALVDTAFRVVENVMGKHPSNPNAYSARPKR